MSRLLPKALERLVEKLELLPGVGHRTAERYGYEILKSSPSYAKNLSKALEELHTEVSYCPKTFCLIEAGQEVSPLYSDSDRDRTTVAVVAQPFDAIALEATGQFHGTYHVLKGLLSPIDGIGPESLTIKELVNRVTDDGVKELILATSGSMEGESTALYIQRQLKDKEGLKITRLARGLPVGVDIEFADQVTLTQALAGRMELN